MRDAAPLTAAERRGRGIVLAVAAAVAGPSVFLAASVAWRGYFPGTALLLRAGIAIAVSACLFRGYDWARRWVPIVLVLDALVTFAILVPRGGWAAILRALPFQALAVAAAIAVWRSESVDRFLTRQASRRRRVMSLRGTGPE